MPDDFDSVVADRFTVLDDVPVPDTWSRVQFKVLDRMPVPLIEEDATMIDLETRTPTDDRQAGSKRVLTAGLLAAAAVVVVVVLAVRSGNDPDVIPPADTAVSSSTDLVVRPLDSPIECELEGCPWSPELTAQALEPPIASNCSTERPVCRNLAMSPDGTLVALDPAARSLTWYEDEPRVVPLTSELRSSVEQTNLIAIGPHDIAYIAIGGYYVAVAPSGAEITRVAWPGTSQLGPTPAFATATGLVNIRTRWPLPNTVPDMPWVDLDGNPITDTRPYPTATATPGVEVRLGERKWLIDEPGIRPVPGDVLPRSDGGVVIVLHTRGRAAQAINVLQLSPDGTIERYFVDTLWPIVLPDGSLIVEHDHQLVRLTPPG